MSYLVHLFLTSDTILGRFVAVIIFAAVGFAVAKPRFFNAPFGNGAPHGCFGALAVQAHFFVLVFVIIAVGDSIANAGFVDAIRISCE